MASATDGLDPDKFQAINLNVVSSSQVSSRTSLVIKHLTTPSKDKPLLCSLQANANVANKLISIVEIAKRELAKSNIKVYQYSALTSKTTTFSDQRANKSSKPVTSSRPEASADDEDDGDDAFEAIETKDKIRVVPVFSVYLTTTPIKELKRSLGFVHSFQLILDTCE